MQHRDSVNIVFFADSLRMSGNWYLFYLFNCWCCCVAKFGELLCCRPGLARMLSYDIYTGHEAIAILYLPYKTLSNNMQSRHWLTFSEELWGGEEVFEYESCYQGSETLKPYFVWFIPFPHNYGCNFCFSFLARLTPADVSFPIHWVPALCLTREAWQFCDLLTIHHLILEFPPQCVFSTTWAMTELYVLYLQTPNFQIYTLNLTYVSLP